MTATTLTTAERRTCREVLRSVRSMVGAVSSTVSLGGSLGAVEVHRTGEVRTMTGTLLERLR